VITSPTWSIVGVESHLTLTLTEALGDAYPVNDCH